MGEINDCSDLEAQISVVEERDGESRQPMLFPEDRMPSSGTVAALQVRLSELTITAPRQ
ncbi:MAG TPA: hypothetical protein VGM64_17425 [Lacunisphaera sp.]